jgi:hypothetical protein
MTNIKKVIATVAVVSLVAGVAMAGEKDKEKLTYQEYRELIAIYDAEAKDSKGMELKEVTSKNFFSKIETKILEKPEKEKAVKVGDKDYEKAEYRALKNKLFDKSKLTK